jgi:stage II sporulation protein D
LDESCPLNPLAQWKVDLSREQIVAKVRGLLEEGEPRLGRDLALFNIETVGQTGSGRVDRVRLRWSDGRATVLTGHEFRMALGHDRIKSTKFTIERLGAGVSYRLSGKGFGHGVGMCQWGARNLAQKGHDFRSILAHYYPRSRIMKLEPDLNRL